MVEADILIIMIHREEIGDFASTALERFTVLNFLLPPRAGGGSSYLLFTPLASHNGSSEVDNDMSIVLWRRRGQRRMYELLMSGTMSSNNEILKLKQMTMINSACSFQQNA